MLVVSNGEIPLSQGIERTDRGLLLCNMYSKIVVSLSTEKTVVSMCTERALR